MTRAGARGQHVKKLGKEDMVLSLDISLSIWQSGSQAEYPSQEHFGLGTVMRPYLTILVNVYFMSLSESLGF